MGDQHDVDLFIEEDPSLRSGGQPFLVCKTFVIIIRPNNNYPIVFLKPVV